MNDALFEYFCKEVEFFLKDGFGLESALQMIEDHDSRLDTETADRLRQFFGHVEEA